MPSAAVWSRSGTSALVTTTATLGRNNWTPQGTSKFRSPQQTMFLHKIVNSAEQNETVSHMGWSLLCCQHFCNSESQRGLISGSDEPSFILAKTAVQRISTNTSSLKMRVTGLEQIPIKKKKSLWKCPNKLGHSCFNENGCNFINKRKICFFLGASL